MSTDKEIMQQNTNPDNANQKNIPQLSIIPNTPVAPNNLDAKIKPPPVIIAILADITNGQSTIKSIDNIIGQDYVNKSLCVIYNSVPKEDLNKIFNINDCQQHVSIKGLDIYTCQYKEGLITVINFQEKTFKLNIKNTILDMISHVNYFCFLNNGDIFLTPDVISQYVAKILKYPDKIGALYCSSIDFHGQEYYTYNFNNCLSGYILSRAYYYQVKNSQNNGFINHENLIMSPIGFMSYKIPKIMLSTNKPLVA